MTDILDRVGVAPTELAAQPTEEQATLLRATFTLAAPARVLLASLALAAAVIHLMMVPPHMSGSAIEGIGFALSGWFQLAVAVLVLVRPTLWLLRTVIAVNLALIAIWAFSRTVGLPVGAHAGQVETAGFVDLACIGFEAALVLASAYLLVRPATARRWNTSALVVASIVPVGILVMTTAAVASPGAAQHGHGAEVTAGDPLHAGAAGHDHATPAAAAAAAGHDHGGLAGHDQDAEMQPDKPLDDVTRKQVADQLVAARDAADRYPTVGDARRAGLMLAGGNAPGVGAHYQLMSAETLKALNPDGTVNAGHPSTYIYGGTLDDAPLVGLMYSSLTDGAPEGFAGPNDHWHRHSNLCLKYEGGIINVPFAPDRDVTREQCDGVQGRFMEKTVWMVHAWVVPGWESPQGVFSHANSNVHCRDGSDDVDAVGFCQVP